MRRLALLALYVAGTVTLAGQGAAPLTLPEGFPRDGSATPLPLTGQQTVRSAGLELSVQYPSGWTVVQIPPYALALRDPTGLRSLTITTPVQAPFRLDAGVSTEQLQQITSALAAREGKLLPRASGQAQLADGRHWVWFELDGPVAQGDWDLSPVKALDYERSRIWTFVTTAGGQFLTINCAALMTRGATADEREAQLSRARGECGTMMHALAPRTP